MRYIDSVYFGNEEYCPQFYNYNSNVPYPFSLNLFPLDIKLSDITFLYGNNGSGKSTILNLISMKLNAERAKSPFREKFYFCRGGACCGCREAENHEYCKEGGQGDFVQIDVDPMNDCVGKMKIAGERQGLLSRFIGSEDIFKKIERRIDDNNLSEDEIKKLRDEKYMISRGMNKPAVIRTDEDEKLFRMYLDSKRMSRAKFCDVYARNKERMQSNGEIALSFFRSAFAKGGLFLIDEPENCLSPVFQLDFNDLMTEGADNNCQFIIATHSPIVLSCRNSSVYDLDDCPVGAKNWYELENVRLYYRLFKIYGRYFGGCENNETMKKTE